MASSLPLLLAKFGLSKRGHQQRSAEEQFLLKVEKIFGEAAWMDDDMMISFK